MFSLFCRGLLSLVVREGGEWRIVEVFLFWVLFSGKEGEEEECYILLKLIILGLGFLIYIIYNMFWDIFEKSFCDCNIEEIFGRVGDLSCVFLDVFVCR